jgi:hypothetical protein
MTELNALNLPIPAVGLPMHINRLLADLGIVDAATLLSVGSTRLAASRILSPDDLSVIRQYLRSHEVRLLANAMLADVAVVDLQFDRRYLRVLQDYGISTAADLLAWLPTKLARLPGIGDLAVKKARLALVAARRLSKKRWLISLHDRGQCQNLAPEWWNAVAVAAPQSRRCSASNQVADMATQLLPAGHGKVLPEPPIDFRGPLSRGEPVNVARPSMDRPAAMSPAAVI